MGMSQNEYTKIEKKARAHALNVYHFTLLRDNLTTKCVNSFACRVRATLSMWRSDRPFCNNVAMKNHLLMPFDICIYALHVIFDERCPLPRSHIKLRSNSFPMSTFNLTKMYLIGCDTDAVCLIAACERERTRVLRSLAMVDFRSSAVRASQFYHDTAGFSIWYFHSNCSHVHCATV